MVKLLLNKGANLSAMDKKERQPIHCAAYLGTNIVLALFSLVGFVLAWHSNNQNACRRSLDVLFLFVLYTGHVDVVKLLVSRSADKSCKDKQGYTPLHAAAASGHIEIVKYLLRMGAEVRKSHSAQLMLFPHLT